MDSDVRTHRTLSPNRRPLLISALLVALTSVPTMIVVAAGSATLNTAPSVRSPIFADPRQGPLVIDSLPRSGLGTSSPSPAGSPTEPLPPVKSRAVTVPRPSSGGTGGGISVVRTGVTPTRAAPPVSSPEVQTPPAAKPPATTPPAPVPVPSPKPATTTGVPIQDRAWPGWDRKLKGRTEAVRYSRYRTGSADRSETSVSTMCDAQV